MPGDRAGACGCSIISSKRITRNKRAVTEVYFYHLQNQPLERVLPQLIEKCLERGWRCVVQAETDERVQALDQHLWTWRDDSFCRTAPTRNRMPPNSRCC